MTDWMKAAEAQKENYLNDLVALMKIPSVRDDSAATDEYPLGPRPAQALKAFLEMAEQDGFKVKNIDNLVGYAEWGEGDETLAILAHLDVMPAGKGWDTDPFDPVIINGEMWGRGTVDTKITFNGAMSAADQLIAEGFVPENIDKALTDCIKQCTNLHRYIRLPLRR